MTSPAEGVGGLEPVGLDALEVTDADSFAHVGVFRSLRRWIETEGHVFLVPREGAISFARALVLNLAYFDPESPRDVLPDRSLPADVLAHVAWHAISARRLWPTVEGRLLGESIASAFDLYLVGRLLGHAPESDFLATQVPALADAALEAGLDEASFEALLEDVARDPDAAFEDLRALLFDVLRDLHRARSPEEALAALAKRDDHRFAPILHHYELSSWVLASRAAGAPSAPAAGDPAASTTRDPAHDPAGVDATLRAAPSAVDWLESAWVRPPT